MENTIQIGHSTYEVHRVFRGNQPLEDVILESLTKRSHQIIPLTKQSPSRYNKANGSAL